MAGENSQYEENRRKRLEPLEIDTVLRSGLRKQSLDSGGAHSHPSTTPATLELPSSSYDFEVIDLTSPDDPSWSEGEGTDAESCIPSSFPPGTDATEDSFASHEQKTRESLFTKDHAPGSIPVWYHSNPARGTTLSSPEHLLFLTRLTFVQP